MNCTRRPQRARAAALALAGLAAASGAAAQLVSDPAYLGGRDAWAQGQWAQAIEALRPLVDPRDRANYEVDYWLGTSLCRSAARMAQGANVLDWSLSFRSMPEAARPTFADEKRLCLQALQAQQPPTAMPAGAAGASVRVAMATVKGTTKLLAVGGGTGNLALAPLRVVRPVPVAELEARLVPLGEPERALAQARVLGQSTRVHASRYTVIASSSPQHGAEALRNIGNRLDDFVEFLREFYGLEPPASYIAVYLYPDIPALRRAALRLHGMQANEATLGYTFGNDRSILGMLTSTAAGTLLHEVFHLVVHESFGGIPQWLDEGLAALYETATASQGLYFGEPNWRSKVFASLHTGMRHIGLAEVVTAPWFSDDPRIHQQLGERAYDLNEQAYLLAYARMFALYLQETKQLQAVLAAFRQRSLPDTYEPARQRALKLLEGALGKPLAQVQAEFLRWAPQAFDPNTRFYANNLRAQEVRKELPQPAFIRRELPPAQLEREPARN